MESTTQTSKQSGHPSPRTFFWANEIEVDTGPLLSGNQMSISGAETLVDALTAHRNTAIDELKEAFATMYSLGDLERVKSFLKTDCQTNLSAIQACDGFLDVIASNGLAELRRIAAQYPNLVDRRNE